LQGLSSSPILFKKVGFGRHFGQLWSEVPRDYLRWILDQKDFDPDTRYTALHYFKSPPRLTVV
jgi:uncharacterized protein (DUF3820 family)